MKLTYNANPKVKAFISSGPIGVSNILKTEIFRYFGGQSIVKIEKKRGGDILDIYLEADANTWYHFNFTRGRMLAFSNNKDFNTSLGELKSKSKKMNVEKGPSYSFDLGNAAKTKKFLRDLKLSGALGGDEPEEKKDDE